MRGTSVLLKFYVFRPMSHIDFYKIPRKHDPNQLDRHAPQRMSPLRENHLLV